MDAEIDFHPVELAAHSLLSGPLDGLHESFGLLHESQHVFLTRLRHIEEKLQKYEDSQFDVDVEATQAHVRLLRKRLAEVTRILQKVEKRLQQAEAGK